MRQKHYICSHFIRVELQFPGRKSISGGWRLMEFAEKGGLCE